MYPDFHHLLRDLFGIDLPVLSLLKTFGFLVAMAFLAGGYVLYLELKRREDLGLIRPTEREIKTGLPATFSDYILQALAGFLVGYKLIGMFLDWQTASPDPMSFLFSPRGSLPLGLLGAGIAVANRYWQSKKESAQGVKVKRMITFPRHRVGDFAVIAALGGFAGAKIFNAFETWEDFLRDPLGNLLSSSGLTFYGGLIVATIALWVYARRIGLDFRHLCDSAAPALILAYGIGRLGCQVSGDGDWGIYNTAYQTDTLGKVVPATRSFEQSAALYKDHLSRHFEAGEVIPHAAVKAPSWLPDWLFAYNYPHNVNNIGVQLPNCQDNYCSVLPLPVFPTPVYEFVMGLLIFGFLWSLRHRLRVPLSMFGVYLMLNGLERFLIEQIRVNYQYDWGFMKPTQAEIIALCIFLAGLLMFLFRKRIDAAVTAKA